MPTYILTLPNIDIFVREFMDTQAKKSTTLILIDGSSFLYRAYYSMRPLKTRDNISVQAVYGFCRMILKVVKTFSPTHLAIVWDSPGKTTRHEIYADYKATRQAPPNDLFEQKKLIMDFIQESKIPTIAQVGIEADDLLYSIAQSYANEQQHVMLITSDKDLYQLLSNPFITIFDPFKDKIIDAKIFTQEIGFAPERLLLFHALCGDVSDNIPGVAGIGKKGATTLAQKFSSIDDLYAHINTIEKQSTKNALLLGKDDAYLSEKLFSLRTIPLSYTATDFIFPKDFLDNAIPFFKKFEFNSLIPKDHSSEKTVTDDAHSPLEKIYQFICITTKEALEALSLEVTTRKWCALDTELSGGLWEGGAVIGFSVATQLGKAYYIPFGHITTQQQLDKETILKHCKPWLEDASIKKIMHHAKFDMLAFLSMGITINGLVDDTLISAHLVTDESQRIKLKSLSLHFFNEKMLSFDEVVTQQGHKNFSYVPLHNATDYAAADAHQTLKLQPILDQKLKNTSMNELYNTIEMPLVPVLVNMESKGILVDKKLLVTYKKTAEEALNDTKKHIISLLGQEWKDINLNSPKQLATLLFEHLKLKPVKKTSGKTMYSTDQEVLTILALEHPIVALIAQYREIFKILTTYLEGLEPFIQKDARVHTSFSQTVVATGRIASNSPNMQNIPFSTPSCPTIHLRKMFIPEKGYQFIAADYSQIELRVLAYLSQDTSLLNAFKNDIDIHTLTAAKLFEKNEKDVTNEERQIGKRINFSILYGITPYGLSQDLKIPYDDAKKYIERYFAEYPGVKAWTEEVIKKTHEAGYTQTAWGRRRNVPGIYEKNNTLYQAACRIAINTAAQGTAAEIMKIGMINLSQAFKNKNIDGHLILQIHDELLIMVHENDIKQAEPIIKHILESVTNWNVPLSVTIKKGNNWHETSK